MKQSKKWIAAACSLLLSVTAMPLSAFADESQSNEEIIYEFLTETLFAPLHSLHRIHF